MDIVDWKGISDSCFNFHSKNPHREWDYQWMASQFIRYCTPDPPLVVDLGSGMSPFPVWLADTGASVVTVDEGAPTVPGSTWGFVDYGLFREGITSLNTNFLDPLRTEEDRQFGVVTCISVAEHLFKTDREFLWDVVRGLLSPLGHKLFILTLDLENSLTLPIWNKAHGKQVDRTSEHGTLRDVLDELTEVGFLVLQLELSPIITASRSVGLVCKLW